MHFCAFILYSFFLQKQLPVSIFFLFKMNLILPIYMLQYAIIMVHTIIHSVLKEFMGH